MQITLNENTYTLQQVLETDTEEEAIDRMDALVKINNKFNYEQLLAIADFIEKRGDTIRQVENVIKNNETLARYALGLLGIKI